MKNNIFFTWAAQYKRCLASLGLIVALLMAVPISGLSQTVPNPTIDMKILIISADGQEISLSAIKKFLNNVGVPYDTLIAAEAQLAPESLWQVNHGYYQGIILTTGNLSYFNAATGSWESALDSNEWETLWQYQADFKVRQVTLYTFPSGYPDNYGLNLQADTETTSSPLNTSLTLEGEAVFFNLNPENPLQIQNAWTYLATPISIADTTPLLVTEDGYAIASVHNYSDGRQNLTITTDHNPYFFHSLGMSYGIINWVTKGVFLGERHVYLTAQIDDFLIDDTIWDTIAHSDQTGITYRITGNDLDQVVAWQNRVRTDIPNAKDITLEMAFNGKGSTGIYENDTLTSVVIANWKNFNWVSHTFSHPDLDNVSYNQTLNELNENHNIAANILGLGNPNYYRNALVTPEISGLNNPDMIDAAYDFGMEYLVSDTSKPDGGNPSPNTGFYINGSSEEQSIFMIPRHPNNLYYNVTNPQEWVSEYNYLYGPQGLRPSWDHNLAFEEILDKESDAWLRLLLNYDVDPVMLHQSNLRAYDSNNGNSLAGNIIEATLTKYNNLFQLPPVLSPSMKEIANIMLQRMAYNTSSVVAILYPNENKIILTAPNSTKIPITGIADGPEQESYGGQEISYINLNAGVPKTLKISESWSW